MTTSSTLPMQTLASMPRDADLFEMGVDIRYHHRAGVARYKKLFEGIDEVGWKITQGVRSGEKDFMPDEGNPDDPFMLEVPNVSVEVLRTGVAYWHKRYMFAKFPQARGRWYTLNKTVMVWPEEGQGTVIGYLRKGIGQSSPGYTSGYEHPEYEQGYFAVDMYVDLYVVKTEFYGTDWILCPIWGVTS
jgi:hypothetical protein